MVVVCNWLVASYQLVGLFEQTMYFSRTRLLRLEPLGHAVGVTTMSANSGY